METKQIQSKEMKTDIRKLESNSPAHECYDDEILIRFIEGDLDEKEEMEVIEHLKECEFCRISVNSFVSYFNEGGNEEDLNDLMCQNYACVEKCLLKESTEFISDDCFAVISKISPRVKAVLFSLNGIYTHPMS